MAPEPSASAALLPVSVERSDVAPSPKPRVPSKVEPAAANKNSLPAKPPTALPMCASRSQWAHATYPYDHTPRCGRYNPDVSIFAVVTAWSGTVLPLVLSLPSFYVMTGLHGLLCYLDMHKELEEVNIALFGAPRSTHSTAGSDLLGIVLNCVCPWMKSGMPTSFLVFFLVFYGNQSVQPLARTRPTRPALDLARAREPCGVLGAGATPASSTCTAIVSASAAPPCSGWPW